MHDVLRRILHLARWALPAILLAALILYPELLSLPDCNRFQRTTTTARFVPRQPSFLRLIQFQETQFFAIATLLVLDAVDRKTVTTN